MAYLPAGTYHERYRQDHAWWQTGLVRAKMAVLAVLLLVVVPLAPEFLGGYGSYLISVANITAYTILSSLGVQLLIGYCGQITLGHAAFIAVGAYATAVGILQYQLPYPVAAALGAVLAGLWSVLFGLPSARIKGFYLIMTTMAAQFITVDFIITQYVSRVGGREQAFSLPPGTVGIGSWAIDTDLKVYYLLVALVILCVAALANLLRTRVGRAWIAIRDNDIAAEAMGVNVVYYKLLAFFAAGALGGIAGAAWIPSLYAVSPEHFKLDWSLWIVGVILIGGIGSLHGVIFGSIFVTGVLELLKAAVIPLSEWAPALSERFIYTKEGAFGLAIVLFLLYEPRGLAYRWQQAKNYFNLWPFAY
ncbi:MAG TPA: branched-chain amino acid ABC transporter permease [Candidatus Sulfotelmatobacter sp.]|nr:branched-chain amino acid ABC transporter permease [Candidatus Sulfotelmatobacter sp.]